MTGARFPISFKPCGQIGSGGPIASYAMRICVLTDVEGEPEYKTPFDVILWPWTCATSFSACAEWRRSQITWPFRLQAHFALELDKKQLGTLNLFSQPKYIEIVYGFVLLSTFRPQETLFTANPYLPSANRLRYVPNFVSPVSASCETVCDHHNGMQACCRTQWNRLHCYLATVGWRAPFGFCFVSTTLCHTQSSEAEWKSWCWP